MALGRTSRDALGAGATLLIDRATCATGSQKQSLAFMIDIERCKNQKVLGSPGRIGGVLADEV